MVMTIYHKRESTHGTTLQEWTKFLEDDPHNNLQQNRIWVKYLRALGTLFTRFLLSSFEECFE